MSNVEHYVKQWEALMQEYVARAERLDAEARLRYNDWQEDMSAEFQAVTDWSEAAWDEFVAKAEQKWHELQLDSNESASE